MKTRLDRTCLYVAMLLLGPACAARTTVFLSFSGGDGAAADALTQMLAGCTVWDYRHSLRSGMPWPEQVEQAIDSADIVVALIGKPCPVCRDEIARAQRKRKRIVPVLLPGGDLPLGLERYFRPDPRSLGALCR